MRWRVRNPASSPVELIPARPVVMTRKTILSETIELAAPRLEETEMVSPQVKRCEPPAVKKPDDEALTKYIAIITRCREKETENFRELVGAIYEIQKRKLCPPGYDSPVRFLMAKFGCSKSYCDRLAAEGGVLNRLSTRVDAVRFLTSDAHLRYLLKLADAEQDEVLDLVSSWAKMAGLNEWSPKLIKAAITFLHPPETGRDPEESTRSKLARQFVGLVKETQAELPDKTEKVILEKLDGLAEKALALGRPPSTTGIDWTEATWNPVQGCTRASAGCDHCYAAKLMATRRRAVYPGLAKEVLRDGKKTYAFAGKIVLLPDHLCVPLEDRTPKRWFVNSMADLFHKGVPDEFIDAVFTVMERASWHQFQVLTKRPERMAEFTEKRYKDVAPPANVWLGTSTENQETYDERRPHLSKTKAAVRWLSVEPMLGPIKFGSMDGIDWVVVGGESGSDRRMEKIWATGVRDQCAESKVAFFFKQWGEFDEAGVKMKKKPKKNGLGPVAKLEGVIHDAYPDDAELALAE